MINAVLDATTRHRHGVLLGGVLVAVAEAIWVALTPSSLAPLLAFPVGMTALLLLAGASFRQRRPSALTVRSGAEAFTAPARAGNVYFALHALLFTGYRAGTALQAIRIEQPWRFDLSLAAFVLVVTVPVVVQAWRGYDIDLRPDGLYDRRILGTLIVAWDSMPTARIDAGRERPHPAVVFPPGAYPAEEARRRRDRPATIRLTYQRPDLVHRRGLAFATKKLVTEHLDAPYLVAVINFYASHPEHRNDIGTELGYRHLQEALTRGSA